jgi:predicted transcriptional regulator/transcriptional regulator with XRE-family HTH domain
VKLQSREKLYVGARVRRLREARGWKLEESAVKLGLSTSYLSQIETSQRPVTARVLIALMQLFETDASAFSADEDQRLAADLREATLDTGAYDQPIPLSEIKQAAAATPAFARQFLVLHRNYRRLEERLGLMDETLSLDHSATAGVLLPYEEVRDYFHFKDNYIHSLDTAAEGLAAEMGEAPDAAETVLERWLLQRHRVRVQRAAAPGAGVLRRFDPAERVVHVDGAHPPATRAFQLAYQIATLEFSPLIEQELVDAGLRSDEARDVCRVGLINYAAGALLLPYGRFLAAAQAMRHDLERLQLAFDASCEQVCHRLSTLQRPGQRGTPFYFVRVDLAGNITKRHSATRLQFARFGGACPLWNVHESFARPGEIMVQLAETPDNVRYLCIATSIVKRSGAYLEPTRKYALAIGCEISHADSVVYADHLDIAGPADPVGVSCRICERRDCRQRAFPPLDHSIEVPRDLREIVPYRLKEVAGQPRREQPSGEAAQ